MNEMNCPLYVNLYRFDTSMIIVINTAIKMLFLQRAFKEHQHLLLYVINMNNTWRLAGLWPKSTPQLKCSSYHALLKVPTLTTICQHSINIANGWFGCVQINTNIKIMFVPRALKEYQHLLLYVNSMNNGWWLAWLYPNQHQH
jgi:hypothetical protein